MKSDSKVYKERIQMHFCTAMNTKQLMSWGSLRKNNNKYYCINPLSSNQVHKIMALIKNWENNIIYDDQKLIARLLFSDDM